VSIFFCIFSETRLKTFSYSLEMLTDANFLVAKSSPKYYCEKCDYKCSKKSNFGKHCESKRHKMLINAKNCDKSSSEQLSDHFSCICGKIYSQKPSLSRHRRTCSMVNKTSNMNDTELVKYLITEFKEVILEQSSKMLELASIPKTANTNTNCNNNNTNNNQFNLQFFLNEKCKDAMNMSDFINSIQIENDDFENMGKLGYVQGISNIFVKNLNSLDETKRPIHCNDIKRETLYIKENNVWDKDENKKQVKQAIALIAHKNFKYIPIWTEANPQAFDCTTKKNDQYMRIANQVATAITPDDESGINKIIRNVSQNVVIDKTK